MEIRKTNCPHFARLVIDPRLPPGVVAVYLGTVVAAPGVERPVRIAARRLGLACSCELCR